MPRTLHVHLLGDFGLRYGDERLSTINTPRLQSLLAYLILHRAAPQTRQHLAFLFWPDSNEAQARTNLRQLLHELRQAMPDADHFLYADHRTLHWRLDAPLNLDVAEFERELDRADSAERRHDLDDMRAALKHAANLYQSDLLPSCYDDWIASERERLRQQYQGALERLLRLLEAEGDVDAAIAYAQQLIRADPIGEAYYRSLMHLLALKHDRAGALHAYHTCATSLQRELGVEPSVETRDVYEQLLQQDEPAAERTPLLTAVSTLVGRGREWEQLVRLWRHAAAGEPQFVLLSGEAGIGKSRLAEELLAWAGPQGVLTARTRSYPAEGPLAFAPVTEWLRSDALRSAVVQLERHWLVELARILPELAREQPDLPHYEPITEHGLRQRFFEALTRAVLAASRPIILLLDDVQWCDQETLEWLHYLFRFDRHSRLLVIASARLDEIPGGHLLHAWRLHLATITTVTEITLGPLHAAECAKLAAHLAGHALDVSAAMRLYAATEGNPLFVVETMLAGLSQAAATARPLDQPPGQEAHNEFQVLPPRVYAVLAGRLANVSAPAHAVLDLAATVGREFTFEVLSGAGVSDADSIVLALDELWRKRIIRERGANSYDFSHDKLREVAYAQIGLPQRRRLHWRVAQALEAAYAGDLDAVSGQVAWHYERTGMAEKAIAPYGRAAEVAQRVYAHEEAARLLKRALAILETLATSATRDEQALELLMSLGVSLDGGGGYGNREVIDVWSRVGALCERLARPPVPQVLRGMALADIVHTRFPKALGLGHELLRRAECDMDPVLIVEAHYILGVTLFWQGELVRSRAHLEQSIAQYDPVNSRIHISRFSQDPKVVCLTRLAFTLWCLGYPDQAIQASENALALAHDLAHPLSLAYALCWDAMLHVYLREFVKAQERSKAVITLCSKQRLGVWCPMSHIFHGRALAEHGSFESGIAEIHDGLASWQAMGCEYQLPYFRGHLAEQDANKGQLARALEAIGEALTAVEKSGERWGETDLHRIRGALLQRAGALTESETAYQQALASARAQNARSFELRAAIGLARLWQAQNRSRDAYQLLSEVYSKFAEGFDTPDMVTARSLLARL